MARFQGSRGLTLPLFLAAFLVMVSTLSACGRATSVITKPTPAAGLDQGKALYAKSCAVCHGANAEGTAAGPGLAGHSQEAMKLQVRNPVGKMPAFPPAQLSDNDLETIALFVAGLAPVRAEAKEWEQAAPETHHHWMALLAIETQDYKDAKHHLEDALVFVPDPKHTDGMKKALALLAKEDIHEAEHEIEVMAGSESPSGITMARFHLHLAKMGLEQKTVDEVKHHMEHFLAAAQEKDKAKAKQVVDLAVKKDLHEAEHELEGLLKGVSY